MPIIIAVFEQLFFPCQVERLLKIEKKVLNIPAELPIGPVILVTNPVKDALHGFAMAWKTQYASVLHEEAKVNSQYTSTIIYI